MEVKDIQTAEEFMTRFPAANKALVSDLFERRNPTKGRPGPKPKPRPSIYEHTPPATLGRPREREEGEYHQVQIKVPIRVFHAIRADAKLQRRSMANLLNVILANYYPEQP